MDEDTTIEQDLDEICQKLKTERAQLEDRIKRDTTRIERLTWAINGIEGSAVPATAPPAPSVKRPSVADMAAAAIDQMHNGTTFDAQSLREKMLSLYPDPSDIARIKMGVYNAIAFLQKHNKVERCPGGFRAVRPVAQPA